MVNPRAEALLILNNVINKGAFLNDELKRASNKNIKDIDYNLLANICKGVLKNKILLDYIIRKNSKLRLKKIHDLILINLEMGVYQIFFTDKIPAYSIVNESVELAKKNGNKGSISFVNGVLRNIVRDKEKIIASGYYIDDLKKNDYSKYLSIKYSHPQFFVDEILKEEGKEFTEDLLRKNNEEAPFFIRVNTVKTSIAAFKELLDKNKFSYSENSYSKNCLEILNPENIINSDLFKKGYFYIQDLASIIVAEIATDKEEREILDLCAAPGGKSINLSLLNREASILACDISSARLRKMDQNIKRLGIKNISLRENDASKINKDFIDKFDLVLVDAPCSGLGLYRRKPEIRYNKDNEDLKNLASLQKQILKNALSYVKVGGNLLYSTCTLSKTENEDVVKSVLKENDNFEIVKTMDQDFKRFYPNIDNTDGFCICKLKRK
ncbi:16S rRNA (cytosine(967)-C(5))-methyltransferase RsmB [Peptoniphilus obesi]|uniref:16S rRNA (cytosine(967)-C(5))-methyltransferase RsmB n=1 Tax=Peptoniphilus obesi TaxID=1472765 RepID=UPI0004AF4280|nr:16S rRNA (cytosine(967)-C(5))-methyltransferase RsmB [Peptoniphilus obesi]